MIIILEPGATVSQREELTADLKARGYGIHLSEGVERTIIGVIGDEDKLQVASLVKAARLG